jgi:hypothetical protein|tara:strand:- start:1404 stop:1676 length:273 start_codon:yes stop_codon:yes gene_type:complete
MGITKPIIAMERINSQSPELKPNMIKAEAHMTNDEEKIIKTALRLALGNLDVIDKAKNEQKYAVMISLNRRLIMPGLSTSANLPLPKSVQ